ncbi:MAG: preprotein translocase subunit YajC [Burkholderiales bacterium]|nr:preprotein translocase subunit YajC [Opitutaceae bacterium]
MTPVSDSLLFVAQAAPAGNPLGSFIMIGFMFAAMWFLIIAPQRKKQKQHAKMLTELDAGDEIVTAGGIYGEITSKKEDRFIVRIADGVKVEIAKSYVQDVVRKKS